MKRQRFSKAYTLIELLVVISIMGILLALSISGMQSARQASRDGSRKSGLEQIRSGLEMYKADCNSYPASLGTSLKGGGSPSTCPATNTYINSVPTDPNPTDRKYSYSSDGITYTLCAALEIAPSPAIDVSGCQSCTITCNYKVTNP